MFIIVLTLILLVSTSCSTLQGFIFPDVDDRDASIEWEKDMKMVINGKTYHGVAVVPEADEYEFKIYPAYKRIDRLTWHTCHGGDHADKAVVHGFWPWSKKSNFFSMKMRISDIERERACPLELEALTMKNKSMAFGIVLFPDLRPWVSLGATLECNRRLLLPEVNGISACQAPVDSIQRISLHREAVQDERPNANCPPMDQISPGTFEYFMPKGKCVYVFKIPKKHVSGRYYQHNLITYGWEKSPPAER